MPRIALRPFAPADLAPVVALWNRCLPKDPLSEDRFWRLFLLDPNFDSRGALVAESDGHIAGFLQTVVRRYPQGEAADRQGWITAFFVDPDRRRQGIGSTLLESALEYLRANGRERVTCNGYSPYYVFPGVDLDYRDAGEFLRSRGFRVVSEPVAMGRSLEAFSIPDDVRRRMEDLGTQGIEARLFVRADTLPLLSFSDAYFPEWRSSVLDSLQRGNEAIWLGTLQGEIVGFAQWQNTLTDPPAGAAGRFGPFGVRPDLRSRGIGAMIFYTLMQHVAAQGARYLWFGWGGGRNQSFYERAGCQVTRRYQLFAGEV